MNTFCFILPILNSLQNQISFKFLLYFFQTAIMGQHFGELAKIRGIVMHTLSPFEQRAFAGAFSKGVPNMLRRIRSEIFYIGPRKLYFYLYFF